MTSGGWERDRNGNVYPTLESAAAEWMAPVADDTGTRTKRYGQGGMALSMQVTQWEAPQKEWMAPQVPNGGRSTAHAEQIGGTMYHNGKKVQLGLESQAKAWAGPAAQNHKGSSQGSITRQDGKSRADILSYQAEQFFHPPSSPAHPTVAAGALCSTDTPNTNQPSVKRKLNPIFVEALMRWPTGLSGFERPAMAWTRWQQQQLTFLSTLFCEPDDEQMSLF
ncbi:hypothetical protein [Blastomonas sp. CCH1-A6]|uniref:hypothetical protein n=1 Tax=Blastomonas sp. CCH1-A6 TaxID=1768762 RepID=UPI001E527FAA